MNQTSEIETYRGKPLEKMSREELIAALLELGRLYKGALDSAAQQREFDLKLQGSGGMKQSVKSC